MLTQERLKELLDYDPETGIFRWRVNPPRGPLRIGKIAGFDNGHGYIDIGVKRKHYRAGRLAWFWMIGEWPPAEIDHIDLNKSNNRWANLRIATKQENARNRPLFRNNKSGLKGVSPQYKGRYRARIRVNGKEIYLGYFLNPNDAHAAYKAFAEGLYGEFWRQT